MGFRPRPRRQRSLFGDILDWMLVPLLLVWPVSIGVTYLVAQAVASQPYDHLLVTRTDFLASSLEHAPKDMGRIIINLAAVDARVGDTRRPTQIRGPGGRLLAGEASLPPPPDAATPRDDGVHLREIVLGGREMRVAWRWVDVGAPGGPSLVQVAEAPTERIALARAIMRGVIVPQFVIVPVSILLVWFGLGQGIVPLDELQARIRRRRPDDLSPIDGREAPEEIAPLVDSINGLLGRLEHSIHTHKRFIADAAHQLKTPLAGLRMQAELAQRQTDTEELRTSLRQISLSVVRTTRMVNQLLSLARAENQGVAAQGTSSLVDLRQPVRDAVQELAPLALDKGLELEFDAPETPLWVRGSAMLLHELAKNLLDNAIAYTDAPGSVVVRVVEQAENWRAELRVEDTGQGIPASERELVFQPFYRVLGTGHHGSGLGLSIVEEIARQHGAAVELADNPACAGRPTPGLVVSIALPTADPAEVARSQPAPAG